MTQQDSLFDYAEQRNIRLSGLSQNQLLEMSKIELQNWKQRIFRYQQEALSSAPAQQGTLFDLAPPHADPDTINPFELPQQNTEFWHWKYDDAGEAALYFVTDYELPLLLYVGETCKANKRWEGRHDCKDYLHNYVAAYRTHDLKVSVTIGFWPHAPTSTRPRQ